MTCSPSALRLGAVLLSAAVPLALARTSAAQPTLGFAVPSAVTPGQTVDVTFFGGNLSGVSGAWTNLPLTLAVAPDVENNGNLGDRVVYRVTVPADAPLGVGGIRVATGQGISNLRLFLIDDLPTVVEPQPHVSPGEPLEIALPVAVDGACQPEVASYYRFTAAAGQRVSIEVYARRLGSPLDPVVRLLDPLGNELAYSDDEGGLGADCHLAFVAPAEGAYTIELRDIRYHGSPAHRFRLRVGNFPLATVPFPLAARRGAAAQLLVAGASGEFVPPLDVTMPPAAATAAISLGARYPGGQGSAIVNVAASDLPETVEIEPNDAPEQGMPVGLPAALNGRLAAQGDRDCFRFAAVAGQRLVFEAKTRSLGSPTDLYLRLFGPDGAVVIEADDAGTDDARIDFPVPADGVYTLAAEDLHHRGGPSQVYRIEVRPFAPGFSLALEAEKFDAPQGGVLVAKVTAARRDYNGPITLAVEGLEGCALAGNVIPEGQAEVVMSVTLPPALAAGSALSIGIVGTAQIGEATYTARASTLPPLRAGLSGLPYPPDALDGAVGLGVGPVFADFFALAVEPATVLLPQTLGAATFVVKAEKLNGFADVVNLAVDGLPDGVTAAVSPIAADQTQVAVTLAGGEALAEGDLAFRVVGSAVFQNQPRTVVLGAVPLRVVRPLRVAVWPAGPVARGATQNVKVTLTRLGEGIGPVAIALANLPAGVTAPEGLVIAEGQSEIDVPLAAAADAPIASIDNLTAVATARIKETDVVVESRPAAFEVVGP